MTTAGELRILLKKSSLCFKFLVANCKMPVDDVKPFSSRHAPQLYYHHGVRAVNGEKRKRNEQPVRFAQFVFFFLPRLAPFLFARSTHTSDLSLQ